MDCASQILADLLIVIMAMIKEVKAHYGVSRWPDEKEIYAKMDRLVNEPIHHIKPEAMQKYMKYFEEKCSGSKK